MKVNELNNLLLVSTSTIIKEQGRFLLEKGCLKKLEGKKYNDTYSLYGEGEGFKSYIRINIKKKKIEKVSCTCLEFNELSMVKSDFMCKHIVSISLKFLGRIKSSKDIKKDIIDKPISRIIRRRRNGEVFYEGRKENGDYRVVIKEENLRGALDNIKKKNIKFTYDCMEIIAPLRRYNIPMRYNFKGDLNSLIITTYKKLPKPLNKRGDVWFFNNEIYLPSSNQVISLKKTNSIFSDRKEIKLPLNIEGINKAVEILYNDGSQLVFDGVVMSIIKENISGEFYLSEERGELYLKVTILYGKVRFNIFGIENTGVRNSYLEEVFLTKVYGCGFKRSGDRCIFIGGEGEKLRLIEEGSSTLNSLGEVFINENVHGGLKEYDVMSLLDEV